MIQIGFTALSPLQTFSELETLCRLDLEHYKRKNIVFISPLLLFWSLETTSQARSCGNFNLGEAIKPEQASVGRRPDV